MPSLLEVHPLPCPDFGLSVDADIATTTRGLTGSRWLRRRRWEPTLPNFWWPWAAHSPANPIAVSS